MPIAAPAIVSCSASAVAVGDSVAAASPLPSGDEDIAATAGDNFARPKSRIFAWPVPPHGITKMLAGLMSRWMMPAACAASSASAIWMASSSNILTGRGER